MFFRQFVDEDLGCASYLIGDEASGDAVVVDPAYAIEPYLEEAEAAKVRIGGVLETHTHADHVSGHGRLALEHGVPVSIHPAGEPEYPFEPIENGQEVRVGELAIRVLHTPGHRPEHCCFLVDGALLTGDSLLIGDAARPDLAIEAREGAEDLYRSLQRLAELPEDTGVYPGHVAGSLCARGISDAHSSTIGAERLTNRALGFELQEFVADSASISAPRPPTTERVVGLNRGPFLGAQPTLEPLASFQGQVLDVRPARQFAGGHVSEALNVPVTGSSFGTRAGFLLDSEAPIALHASSPEEAELTAGRLHAVGILDLAGYLVNAATPDRLEPIGIEELERLVADDAVEVIDVREKEERDGAYIPGSRHIPYRLVRAYRDELENRRRPVVTVCGSGERAGIAASVLAAEGIDARPLLGAGIHDWEARGNPVTAFRRCGGSG